MQINLLIDGSVYKNEPDYVHSLLDYLDNRTEYMYHILWTDRFYIACEHLIHVESEIIHSDSAWRGYKDLVLNTDAVKYDLQGMIAFEGNDYTEDLIRKAKINNIPVFRMKGKKDRKGIDLFLKECIIQHDHKKRA